MAEIEWKGIIWKAAFGNFTYKELLTILKGYGSMEIVAFEKPQKFKGYLSIALNKEGTRDITLYYIEILGPKRHGLGREALKELRKIFQGKIFIEDPGEILTNEYTITESLLFWIRMFEEGLIDGLESDHLKLYQGMPKNDIKKQKQFITDMINKFNKLPEYEHKKSS